MSSAEELRKELQKLQAKRQKDQTVAQLKKQIRAEKFAQTKGGKVFNAIGDFGLNVAKKIATPPKQASKGKKKKTPARMSVEELMKRLPQ